MRAVSGEEMRRIDHYAIDQLEIPSIVLMENAARAAMDQVDLNRRHSFAIFCGMGNNGGDGLAMGRNLMSRGKRVRFYLVGSLEKASPDFMTNYRILQHMGADLRFLETLGQVQDLPRELQDFNTLIDALFGTGLNRPLRDMAPVIIEIMNESRIFTISLDVPSGLDATTGQSYGAVVQASAVLTFECMKEGLEKLSSRGVPVRVLPIGIPRQAKAFVLGEDFDRD